MRVAVLFDAASALGESPDLLILDTVEAVERALAENGAHATRIPAAPDGRWIERVRRGKFDLAFNLCEGIDAVAATEPAVISALELIGVRYTGSSSWTTALCLRKNLVNTILGDAGLPVPPWGLARPGAPAPVVGFPAITKPAAEDASIGVEQGSVVRSVRALNQRLDDMYERWDEVLVQRFVDGREVNVGIVGDEVLPVAEIDFGAMPRGKWRIVTYMSKWETGCDEDLGAMPRCPAELPHATTDAVKDVALAAWRLVGGAGYGRVDLRIDRAGRPWILEVNANPDFAADAGLARMARVAGYDYAGLVRRVCECAMEVPQQDNAAQWLVARKLSGIAAQDLAAAGTG
jgi:D-alanine-D-alanine ligase